MNRKIKVLIVCSGNAGFISPFVKEQVESLTKIGVDTEYFLIKGKGWFGYLMNYPALLKKIRSFKPDLVHAHYGMSGMLSVLQRNVPVIVTFHGSDINTTGIEKLISNLAIKFSKFNLFVSSSLAEKAGVKNKFKIISCGIDMTYCRKLDQQECRKNMGFNMKDKYALFSSSFDIPVKNYKLAHDAISYIEDVNLIELKGYSKEQVNQLMNACDLLLVTSLNEGGPLVVKEALACGCPVVTTNVGDVKDIIGNTEGCYITGFSAIEISEKIRAVISTAKRIEGRQRIYDLGLDIDSVSSKIYEVYDSLLKKK